MIIVLKGKVVCTILQNKNSHKNALKKSEIDRHSCTRCREIYRKINENLYKI